MATREKSAKAREDRGLGAEARKSGGCEEYLRLCTGQVRCRAMRSEIQKELLAHIEDQKEAYMAGGMEETEAERMAVEQMGDPLETGAALDRIHRPKMNRKALGAILLLAGFGFLMQVAFREDIGSSYTLINYIKSTALGILLMAGICFVDYTVLGKYPRTIWCAMTALVLIMTCFTRQINGMRHSEYMLMLLVPCYAGLVFHYRRQRYAGIGKALGWLFLTWAAVLYAGPDAMIGKIWMCGGIVILAYAVASGWYDVKKWIAAAMLGLPLMLGAGAAAFLWLQAGYRRARIHAFLHPYEEPTGTGYIYVKTREMLHGLKLFGASGAEHPEGWWRQQNEDFALLHVGERYGLFMLLLVAVLLFVFAGALFWGISRQCNRLGVLTGIGCVYVFMVSVVFHTLISVGWLPATCCAMPFLSMNGKQNVCLYVLMGLLLSVFRGNSIRPEPLTRLPRIRLRLTWNDDRAL